MCADSTYLALSFPRIAQTWPSEGEPDNSMDSILKSDNSEWTSSSPIVDLALCDREDCFIAQVEIQYGGLRAGQVIVFICLQNGDWIKVPL